MLVVFGQLGECRRFPHSLERIGESEIVLGDPVVKCGGGKTTYPS